MNKNFGLSPQEFDKIVSNLQRNEIRFFEEVFLQHFKDCMVYLQKQYSASYDDAYDATMDTMIEFRKRLVDGKLKYGNLRFLFTKMASQVFLRNKKSFQAQEIQEKDIELDSPANNEEDVALINAVWEEMGEACQKLLKLHYYGKMKLAEIAEYQQKSPAAIRKQKERCVNKLKKLILSKKKEIYHHE